MSNKQNCVIYSRVSTEAQSNESAINDLKRLAVYMKYEILDVFNEKISGTTKVADRNAFNELVQYCDENSVDNILVWEISRLSRRGLLDTLQIIDYFTKKEINILTKKEGISTLNEDKSINETAKMTLGIMGSVADYERTTIIERSKRGLKNHLKKGGAFSLAPYGYTNKNKMIVIHEDEAQVVQRIYQLFIDGKSSPYISKTLNAENIPTKKNRKWSDVQVRYILHNTMYFGKRQYNFGTVDVPPIVTESEHLKVQQIFKNNSNLNQDKAIYVNYLSGLIKCGSCGLTYFQHARKSKRDFAYKCMSNRKVVTGQLKQSCNNSAVNINLMNSMTYMAILSDLLKFSNTSQLDSIIVASNADKKQVIIELSHSISIERNEIKTLNKRLYNLNTKAIDLDLPIEEHKQRKHLIDTAIDKCQIKLNKLLIQEAEISSKSKDEEFYKTLKDNLKNVNIEATDNHLLVDKGLYSYYTKSLIKSILVENTDVNDYASLYAIIPLKHHKRLKKITITTLFYTYVFYTVNGFPMYSYEVWDNGLVKTEMVEVVKQ